MKPFVFKLSSVLALRAREEEAAKQDYLHAVSAHSQLQSAHVEALAELENYQHALAAKREGNSSRNDQVLFLNALQYQREYCTRLGERLAAAERELEAKRDALMVAKRRHEALTRLERRHRMRHEAAAAREAEASVADLITARVALRTAEAMS